MSDSSEDESFKSDTLNAQKLEGYMAPKCIRVLL